jgi:putative DNA primase/helicase
MTAAEQIAKVLGGAYRSGTWWRSRCPVHGSRGGTLALHDGDRGLIIHCHAGCGRREIVAALKDRGLLSGRPAPRPGARRDQSDASRMASHRHDGDETDRRRRIAQALDVWNESYPDTSIGLVGRYFRTRGIFLSIPPTIRIHGAFGPYGRHPQSGERRPQLVALVEHVDHGPVGVSRTFLAIDGSGKATLSPPRLFCGPVKGGAVRLTPAGEQLMVSEGIETGLAAMQACQLPAWAALSTSGMAALVLPPAARTVIILADHDENGAGEAAARAAADRWLSEGRRVRIAMPPEPGSDFNDLLVGARMHAPRR